MTSFLDKLFGLEGRVAAITGGGGYLCGEMARGLAKAGCKIAVMDLRGHKAEDVARDIRDSIGVEADILINGAGINAPTPFLDITIDEFNDVMRSQITSTLLGCQVFGRHMLDQGNGVIINISSASAGPPLSKAFSYSIAKAGILNLTQNLGREWGTKGVRVNAIRPGFFPTEWNRKNFITKDREAAIFGHTPMARYGEVDELVGAVIYLASDAASFVTGSELTVDGGFSCMTI
jgi:NAD(P)-dependent dehydrogenase (short-subunit alcohol dehydrogenase family)